MRRIPAVATCVAAALSLALTGCGGDGKKRDKGSSGSTASVEPAEKTPGKGGGKDGAEQTASPTPARTKKATPTPTRPATPTAAATPTRPRASAPAVPPKKTARPDAAGPQSVQGTWYHVRRGTGGRLIVLTVNGTSMSMTSGGKSCPGTITSAMVIRATCMGESAAGTARLSGGQLTFAWPDGSGNDYFRRTQPAA
ncbi:hypothetical protein [Streptomyces alboflavus]|uniref:hypothetical protein n=1 Tax=Streptomyces alboflavus TaxID=67267 RepID=UPI001386C92B|nr:hypothetical protein [Streptomyces alboflavus]